MKKFIFLSLMAFTASLVLSSCKKDRTCVCSYQDPYVIKNQSKKKAEEICEGNAKVGLITVSGDNGCYLQ